MPVTVAPELSVYPISVERYWQMVEREILTEDDTVELIGGVLVEMTPQGEEHLGVIEWLNAEIADGAKRAGYIVRPQLPLSLPHVQSVPEPDLAVLNRGDRAAGQNHLETPSLVIEVSFSSQAVDRGEKARRYSAAGIADYWVVDVKARSVSVYRQPALAGYESVDQVAGGVIAPLDPRVPAIDVDAMFAYVGL